MKKILPTILILILTGAMPVFCAEENSFNLSGIIESIMNRYEDDENTVLYDNEAKQNFLYAVNNVYNGNIVVARSEFSKTIDLIDKNFALMMFAKKLYEYGFFTLGDKALSKIEGKGKMEKQIKLLQEAYKPNYQLSESEENFLVKAYSSIFYNNSPEEVAFNLVKKTNLLEDSDYANYIMALSMFECKQYNQTLIYVNRAIEKNDKNSTYKNLKAKTLLAFGKYKEALKYIEENENTISIFYKNDFNTTKQQVLSNLVSNETDKKYYQIYSYYLDGNYYKVLKETQNLLNFYKNNPKILALQGMAYLALGDKNRAKNSFDLSYKQNKNFPLTQMGMADCSFINQDYKTAYNKYQKLINTEFKNEAILKSYITLEKYKPDDKKLQKLKKQKETFDDRAFFEYYTIANNLFSDDKEKQKYIAKSLIINLLNKDSWDVLFKIDYKNKNYDNIDRIAFILLFSDDMNAEYYYYSALSLDNKNQKKEAFYELKKALNINPDYKPAIDMMTKLQNELI